MDHQEIEERNIPDLYLMNKLSSEMKLRFEEHFVSCPECLNRLEETDGFRRALKSELIGRSLRPVASSEPRSFFRQFAFTFSAVAILLAAGLGLTLVWRAWSGQQRESAAVEELRNRLAAQTDSLEQEKARNAQLNDQIATLSGQQLSPPVFPLVITRGIPNSGERPVNSIVLPQTQGWFILLLELPVAPAVESYRVTFRDSQGTVVSTLSGLKSTSADNLAVSLSSFLFTRGSYAVILEGLRSGRYSFQVR